MELREHNWIPRKAFLDNGPKTINQIRQDAVKVSISQDTDLAVQLINRHQSVLRNAAFNLISN